MQDAAPELYRRWLRCPCHPEAEAGRLLERLLSRFRRASSQSRVCCRLRVPRGLQLAAPASLVLRGLGGRTRRVHWHWYWQGRGATSDCDAVEAVLVSVTRVVALSPFKLVGDLTGRLAPSFVFHRQTPFKLSCHGCGICPMRRLRVRTTHTQENVHSKLESCRFLRYRLCPAATSKAPSATKETWAREFKSKGPGLGHSSCADGSATRYHPPVSCS